jgi:hypothetical protein
MREDKAQARGGESRFITGKTGGGILPWRRVSLYNRQDRRGHPAVAKAICERNCSDWRGFAPNPPRLDFSAASSTPHPPKPFVLVGAADTVCRMASSGGGFRATNEIPQLEMKIVEPAPEEPGRVGSKRVRDSLNDVGSQGKPPRSLSACMLYWFVCCFSIDCCAVGLTAVRLLGMLEPCRRIVDEICGWRKYPLSWALVGIDSLLGLF